MILIRLINTQLIQAQKVAGALVSPNGRIQYSQQLYHVLNTIFYSSPSLIYSRQYISLRSSFMKILARRSLSRVSLINSRGVQFLTITALSPQQSTQSYRPPPFLGIKRIDAPVGLVERLIQPLVSAESKYSQSIVSSDSNKGYYYYYYFIPSSVSQRLYRTTSLGGLGQQVLSMLKLRLGLI